ncbi:MAG: hypothetical protein ACYDDI_07065 [Candidatus Acidiferrales bacterium]
MASEKRKTNGERSAALSLRAPRLCGKVSDFLFLALHFSAPSFLDAGVE